MGGYHSTDLIRVKTTEGEGSNPPPSHGVSRLAELEFLSRAETQDPKFPHRVSPGSGRELSEVSIRAQAKPKASFGLL